MQPIAHKQGGGPFCKTQQVVGFDCAGIERLSAVAAR